MILAGPGALWRILLLEFNRKSSTRSGDGASGEYVKPSRPLRRISVMLETLLVRRRCSLTSLAQSAPLCEPRRRQSMVSLGTRLLGPPLFRHCRVGSGPRLTRRRLPDGRSMTAAASCAFRRSAQKSTDLLALLSGLKMDGPNRPSRRGCVWTDSQGTEGGSSALEVFWP